MQKSADGMILCAYGSIEEFFMNCQMMFGHKVLVIEMDFPIHVQFQSNETKCVRMEIDNSEKKSNKRNWWIIISSKIKINITFMWPF